MQIRSTGRQLRWLGLALALAGGLSAESEAGVINLGTANGYNVFVLGNNTQSGTDAEGRVAVGGNADFGNGYSIASKRASGSVVNLVVGGSYSNTNNTVNGSVVIGGNANINNPTINGNLSVNGNLTLTSYGTVNGGGPGGNGTGNVTYGTGYNNAHTTISGTVAQGITTLPDNFASEQP